jgi:hypothetical protein
MYNMQQVSTFNSTNFWDDAYPSGGNWWSNYNGTDVYSGSHQNITGSDGIGDTPYIIDSSNQDRYPLSINLREPFGIIRGIVTDADTGSFIVGAIVKWDSQQTTTASNGSYTFSVDAGTYTISVSKDGFDTKTSQITVDSGVTQTANFSIARSTFPIIFVAAGMGGVAIAAAVMLLKRRKPKPLVELPKPFILHAHGTDRKKCQRCDADLPIDAKFCSNCGASQP